MSDVETHIKLVNTRLLELIKSYASLKKDNQHLNQQLFSLKLKEKENKEIINSLQQKVGYGVKMFFE